MTPTTAATSSAPPSPRKVALASAVGATIEWYDFFLYGTAAGLVFDKLAAWLVTRGDGSLWPVAGYHVAVAALSLACARQLPETHGRDLAEPWVLRAEPERSASAA